MNFSNPIPSEKSGHAKTEPAGPAPMPMSQMCKLVYAR